MTLWISSVMFQSQILQFGRSFTFTLISYSFSISLHFNSSERKNVLSFIMSSPTPFTFFYVFSSYKNNKKTRSVKPWSSIAILFIDYVAIDCIEKETYLLKYRTCSIFSSSSGFRLCFCTAQTKTIWAYNLPSNAIMKRSLHLSQK